MKRVGIICINHESNTFVPGRTTLDDFLAGRLLVRDAARGRTDWGTHELGGFIDGLKQENVESVPLLVATATPGPVIEAASYQFLLDRIVAEISAAGHLDGLLLAPHGAAVSEDYPDADGHWLSLVRGIVDSRLPIISTLDPHANVSPAMVAATNALIAYRTNPHLDQHARGLEAATLMARTLRGEVWPVQAAALTPVSINIERQHTVESPCRDLQDIAREIANRSGILSSSIILGFPYADVAEMGSGAIVVADGDQPLADAMVRELGHSVFDRRAELVGRMIDPADPLMLAANMPGPVCLLDMGDNVGGGSTGDGTTLAHLVHRSGKRSFVCLHDSAAVAKAFEAGINARLRLDMGGKSGDPYGPPLVADVTIRALTEGQFTDLRPRHGGTTHYDIGRTAVAELASGLTVMLTTLRAFPVSIVQLTSCGLDPKSFEIIIVKGVHAPVTAYAEACRSFLRVNTPGMTSADMAAFKYQRRRRPLFPFEEPSDGINQYIYRGNRV